MATVIKTSAEFVEELRKINNLINVNRPRFTKGLKQGTKDLISQVVEEDHVLTQEEVTQVNNDLRAWQKTRTRNHNVARGFLHTAAVLFTGPFFHLGYALWRLGKNISNMFLFGPDQPKDFTKVVFGASVGKAHGALKEVKEFLSASELYSSQMSEEVVEEASEVEEVVDESSEDEEIIEINPNFKPHFVRESKLSNRSQTGQLFDELDFSNASAQLVESSEGKKVLVLNFDLGKQNLRFLLSGEALGMFRENFIDKSGNIVVSEASVKEFLVRLESNTEFGPAIAATKANLKANLPLIKVIEAPEEEEETAIVSANSWMRTILMLPVNIVLLPFKAIRWTFEGGKSLFAFIFRVVGLGNRQLEMVVVNTGQNDVYIAGGTAGAVVARLMQEGANAEDRQLQDNQASTDTPVAETEEGEELRGVRVSQESQNSGFSFTSLLKGAGVVLVVSAAAFAVAKDDISNFKFGSK